MASLSSAAKTRTRARLNPTPLLEPFQPPSLKPLPPKRKPTGPQSLGPTQTIKCPLKSIPRLHWRDNHAMELMHANQPVVLTGTNLVDVALKKWSLPYLEKHIAPKAAFTMYTTDTNNTFMYDKMSSDGVREDPVTYLFEPKVKKEKVTFKQFRKILKIPLMQPNVSFQNKNDDNKKNKTENGKNIFLNATAVSDASASEVQNGSKKKSTNNKAPNNVKKSRKERIYLQQALYDGIGKQIKKDFSRFHWAFIQAMQALLPNFGDLTTNMLLIGEYGNITPCHYDEQQNFFAQVNGNKKCILFSPNQYSNLYPYPVGHPADRQSQVDLYSPNYDLHSNFAQCTGMVTVLEPGDVLFIPNMWYHHFENLSTPCTSVNFWFKCGKDDPMKVELPLRDATRLMSMRRNVEKMTIKKLGSLLSTLFFGALEQKQQLQHGNAKKEKERKESDESNKSVERIVDGVDGVERVNVNQNSNTRTRTKPNGSTSSSSREEGAGVSEESEESGGSQGSQGSEDVSEEEVAIIGADGRRTDAGDNELNRQVMKLSPADLESLFVAHEISIRGMLKVVLAEKDIDMFVHQLVAGRFLNEMYPDLIEKLCDDEL